MKNREWARIPVDIVLDDWRQAGATESIYGTPLGVELSAGDLHSGTVVPAILSLPAEIAEEIRGAWDEHRAYPVVRVFVNLNRPAKHEASQ